MKFSIMLQTMSGVYVIDPISRFWVWFEEDGKSAKSRTIPRSTTWGRVNSFDTPQVHFSTTFPTEYTQFLTHPPSTLRWIFTLRGPTPNSEGRLINLLILSCLRIQPTPSCASSINLGICPNAGDPCWFVGSSTGLLLRAFLLRPRYPSGIVNSARNSSRKQAMEGLWIMAWSGRERLMGREDWRSWKCIYTCALPKAS